ncbi:MAG TPA: glycosyltransferase family 2 protein [Mycobacteriales bacterium]|nr:glycosyltransferase family 2 protein [Mycobacteriales bacterium]
MPSRPTTPTTGGAGQSADWPAVSVVLTVLNEELYLRAAMAAVLGQDYPAAIEVVIALGPSRDRTNEVAAAIAAEDPRVRTVANPSGRTPEGLNRAIEEARYPVIARVDGHSELPLDYLRIAVETMRRTGADNVGGLMWAEGRTPFERAVARAMTSRFGVGNAPFHVGGQEGPADTVYLGVFRREAIEGVGGYDERFTRAQDWEMNYRLRSNGGLVWFTPKLRVAYRPRADVRSLASQYHHYGRWRYEVMRRHPSSVNLRYLAPPTALLGLGAGVAAGIAGAFTWPWLLLGFAAPATYVAAVLLASVVTSRGLPPKSRALLVLVYPTMHICWGSGFLSSVMTYRQRGRR